MRGLGIDWDEEDAAEQAARQPQATKKQEPLAVQSAFANAVVPPSAVAQPATAPVAPPTVKSKQPQSFAESIIRKAEPYLNPVHLKPGITEYTSYQDIDPYATALHGIGEYLAYQHGINPIVSGITQGVGNRISKSISGVDPTIKAQNDAKLAEIASSEKIAAMKYGQAQGPDRSVVSTVAGRIEPTFDITPVPFTEAAPDVPPVIAKTPEEPLAKPNPLDTYSQQKHGYTLAELEAASGGPLKNPADINIVATSLKNGRGITVNTLPGAVSNAPTSIPTGQPNVNANPAGAFAQQPNYSAAPPTAPQSQFDRTRIGQPLQDPLAGRGYQTPPQEIGPRQPVAPSVAETVATGGNVGQAVKQTVANLVDETPTPTEKPVYPKGESLKTIPPGFVFREDVGNLDRSLGNILGKEHREYARELFNQGKPFGHSADLNNDVSRLTNEYWQRLQSEMPESLLGRDARRAQNIQSEFGTFAKNTNFGQKAKFAGKLGTLFALSDLANAKTAEQKANAGVNLLGAVLPPGMDINDVGAPTVPSQKISQAALLGSPYAQTDWAKTQRLREKAGAGRGIAPPSAYR